MDPTATNALALAALLFLPLLQALCPRLAPDVISGKVIPCRYLCIKINFFELPSIVFSTERDGVLCSTLLLRRRGVCKNGGCVPFESEDQKPKGIFNRVITSIDKFASGSFRKTVPGPDAQFGPIVTISPSLVGGGSKDATGGTSEPASGLSPSSPSAGVGSAPVVKAVSSTLKNIWTQAFPLNLRAPPRTRPSASGKAPSNAPDQTLGGVTPGGSNTASVVDIGAGPPAVPPLLAEGSNNASLASGTSQRSKLFGSMPGLASTLSLRRAITTLRGKNSVSGVTSGSPSSPVGGINLVSAAGFKEAVPAIVVATSRPNAVSTDGGPPTVPPLMAPGSNNEGPASETPRVPESSGILSGLISTTGLGGILNTSHDKKSGIGLPAENASILAAGISTGSAAVTNEGVSGTVGGTPRLNMNLGGGPSKVAPITPQGSGNEHMVPETTRESGFLGGISRFRSRLAVNSALNRWKSKKHEPGAAPERPSSTAGGTNAGSVAVVNRSVSGAVGETLGGKAVNITGSLPVSPMNAMENNNRTSASDTPGGLESPGLMPVLTSTTGLDSALKTSQGKDSRPSVALESPNSSAVVRNGGIAGVIHESVPRAVDKAMGANEKFREALPTGAPMTPPSSHSTSMALEASRGGLSPEVISTLPTKITLDGAGKKPQDEKSGSGVAPVSLNSPAVSTSGAMATVTTAGASSPSVAAGGTSLAPVVEFTGHPPTVPRSIENEARRVSETPSEKTEGSGLPSGIRGGPTTATPPISGPSGSAMIDKAPRPPQTAPGHATPVSPLRAGAPHTPSLGLPARRLFGGIASAASALARAKEGRTLTRTSTNGGSQPGTTSPASEHRETRMESDQADKKSSDSSLKVETPRAPISAPMSGDSLMPRRFISNFLGRRR
ncbi:mucin-19-like isoform X1 [Dermacentor silvarum]|uniref:mucin-19-like isoform X1 n=1 Tax=Dermacentor silvarum TaxID=543639 RepID=UPI001896F6CA|nr:mucin-19-like isoform X1 [Dermacentor silvarum]